ncbi:hypothetical protein Salat_0632700 [Sesamum alatum]|uniref:Uncharacterized protein n=1 Tax=Sesamum alatum TaxID=300844 RepID=A0AAE1YQH3_9LAMI|nr:hypothetical protein Salat_0632700 [Sesamum alatum]
MASNIQNLLFFLPPLGVPQLFASRRANCLQAFASVTETAPPSARKRTSSLGIASSGNAFAAKIAVLVEAGDADDGGGGDPGGPPDEGSPGGGDDEGPPEGGPPATANTPFVNKKSLVMS